MKQKPIKPLLYWGVHTRVALALALSGILWLAVLGVIGGTI